MADLSPDTSIYRPFAQQAQPLDLGRLMSMIGASRQLQTQSGIAAALRANPNDPNAAYNAAVSNPNNFLGPEDVAGFAHAAEAQTNLQQHYFNVMADTAASVLGSGRPIDDRTVNGIAVQMRQQGVPADKVAEFINTMPPESDQRGRQLRISQLQNLRTAGAAPAGLEYVDTPQGRMPVTGAARRYGTYAPPTQQAQAPGGPPPNQAATFAPGEGEDYASSAKSSQNLQDRAQSISQQRSLLAQMSSELKQAEVGGPALSSFRMHVNQTLTGLGLPALDPEEKLSATELFNKFSRQLQQQQAAGWTTEANLHSTFEANPSIALSAMGNRGVLAFLQGNLDTENLVLGEWNKWRQAHGGAKAGVYFRQWLNDSLPQGMGRGFNSGPNEAPGSGGMRNFDPRILQFEHLNPEDKQRFYDSLDDNDKKKFASNLNKYKQMAYLGATQ